MSTTTEYEQMEQVRILDSLRSKVRKQEKEGYKGLRKRVVRGSEENDGWIRDGDLIEVALVLSALSDSKKASDSDFQKLSDKLSADSLTLTSLDPGSFFEHIDIQTGKLGGTDDHVPVLRAAIILETLSRSFPSAFSSGGFGSYARIVYELYKASEPDEMLGGAGPGSDGGAQTAFVTMRCIRAVVSFANMCRDFAELTMAVVDLQEKPLPEMPQEWWDIHANVLKETAAITTKLYVDHWQFLEDGQSHEDKLRKICNLAEEAASKARATIEYYSAEEKKPSRLGRDKVRESFERLEKSFTDIAEKTKQISDLAAPLNAIAKELKEKLRPTSRYLESILDRELASALSQSRRIADGAELLFAVNGLAMLGNVEDARIERVLRAVSEQVTDAGRIPSHRPFDVFAKGYVLHVAAAESIRAFAELTVHAPETITAELVQKLLRHFGTTWQEKAGGWRHERDNENGLCQQWLTVVSLRALQALGRGLDKRINQLVLSNLSVRQPVELKNIGLPDLFYPDFGLVVSGLRKKSIANVLQGMRAHILGDTSQNHKYSLVLYGPPGTGKTTIAEALAKTCEVPLVEVTPSDILLAGVEKIETRARLVFDGLSMLTDVVILFDEFDSILWSREAEEKPEGILRFLTPGMLPKLKKLYEHAKKQRIGFILSTNLIGGLDKAATREGRFDVRLGIYPPDLLSRYGRLTQAWATWMAASKSKASFPKAAVTEVVQRTAGAPMARLGKPSWFTAPNGTPDDDSPFSLLLGKSADVDWPVPEKKIPEKPEEDYGKEPLKKLNPEVLSEWKEWYFIGSRDRKFELENGEIPSCVVPPCLSESEFETAPWESWKASCDAHAQPPI
ncbi:MAG TPA: ATP-binding protein [Chthoniobacterales bacterium]|nr:ATP-binding protein [Chthoniobacterales bacterium]